MKIRRTLLIAAATVLAALPVWAGAGAAGAEVELPEPLPQETPWHCVQHPWGSVCVP